MPFDLDSSYPVYLFAAASVVLFVEAIYLLCFKATSYRSRVNRRIRLLKDQPDRESVLIQLRRERGLTGDGLYGFRLRSFNRLILQSGLTIGLEKLAAFVAIGAVFVFGAVLVIRGDAVQAACAALIAGLVLPHAGLYLLRRRRHRRFGDQFPDAIDIIVRSLRSGHPVPIAIAMVARELKDPVGTEFGMAADEITYGADLETAMRNLLFRVGHSDLPLFVTAVAIQVSTGGNLGEILENLSATIRQRLKMRRKIKALAAEGRFSAFFLSGLPVAIFLLLGMTAPDFYGSIWDQSITRIGLALAGCWMGVGNLVMYRMVNFRI